MSLSRAGASSRSGSISGWHLFLGITLCLFLSLFAQPLLSAESPEVAKEPTPSWVESRSLPQHIPDDDTGSSGGSRVLIMDEQVNLPAAQRYGHYARAFTSQSGVQEYSRITFTLDPTYQKLALHSLQIHRDGETIDRLPSAQVRVLARESSLDRHLYDGHLSAVIDVEDVRVGDVLEYSFSITGRNPIFADHYSDFFTTQLQTPLKSFFVRVLAPKDSPLRYFSEGPELAYSTKEDGDVTEYRWEAKDLPSVFYEGEYPDWFTPYGWLQISDYPDWKSVGDWAQEFYRIPETLPPAIEEKLTELRQLSDAQAQIIGVLDFVQNKIRYLSVSTGVHAYRPYPLEDVVSRGFGDCKDKALLTSTMLRRLGFSASPALVESRYMHRIGDWLPSPYNFDHVVVALDWRGRRYWLDPTRDFQGGRLEDRFFPPYGKAFIIQDGASELENVTASGFDAAEIRETKTYYIAEYDKPTDVTIDTKYGGREADWMRQAVASQSREDLEHNYLNYITKQHGKATSMSKPKFDDDIRENAFSSMENYQVESLWKSRSDDKQRLYADFHPYLINGFVAAPESTARRGPLAVAYPKRITETVEIHLPDNSFFKDEDFEVSDPAFNFFSKVRLQNRKLTVTHHYESLMDNVPASRSAEYLENLRKVRESLGYSITIPKSTGQAGSSFDNISINWMLVVLCLMVAAISLAAAVAVFFWRPAWPPRPASRRYKGLSGWLILVGFGLFLRPITLLFAILQGHAAFNTHVWDSFTRPGQDAYHPLWMPAILLELGIQIPLLIFSLLLIILFFLRRKTFPIIFIIVIGTLVVFSIVDSMLAMPIVAKFPDLGIDNSFNTIIQTIVQAAIWIPYMLISQRVAATFTK